MREELEMRWKWKDWASLSTEELYELLALRQVVFVVEQDCPYLDADGLDSRAHHLLGYMDDQLVAYARAFPPGEVYTEAAIGRVITAPSIRGQGQGRPLMREAMNCVHRTYGPTAIKLSAQAHLEPYYQSLGFEVCGEGYDEDGIPHLPMRCRAPGT